MQTRLLSLSATYCLILATFWTSAFAQEAQPKAAATNQAPFVESEFPFFSSVLDGRKLGAPFPKDNLTPRGLILNLGHGAWACFDTELLRVSAIWTGEGVSPASMAQISYRVPGDKAVEGTEKLPVPLGKVLMASGLHAGWQVGETPLLEDPRPQPYWPIEPEQGQFQALRVMPQGVLLEYEVAGAAVRELVEARSVSGGVVVQRRFRIEGVSKPLTLVLGKRPAGISLKVSPDHGDGRKVAQETELPGGVWAVKVSPGSKTVDFSVSVGLGSGVVTWKDSPAKSSAARWSEVVVTKGNVSANSDAYVVDEIAVPTDNLWKRRVRIADLGFLPDGRAAAVTFDGDVWLISGLDADLDKVTWKRFTSGLHEPLGLTVREGEIFVFDRNGVWRLRDDDKNGEADGHELFCNNFAQTAETREYASSLRLAPDGSFIIAKGGIRAKDTGPHSGVVLRISPDGKTTTVLGHGLRGPFIGVNPKTGVVTASDQEGNYTPATPLHIISDNRYYGFLPSSAPKEKYPEPIADPLVWIPHSVNGSGATQAWLHDARMGPLDGSLVHLGYYRPELFLVLPNERSKKPQAAVVSLTRDLSFSPLAGAMNPKDGQFYVTGFQIWGTNAKNLSGLARIRHTGLPSVFPREVSALKDGVLLRFDTPLDAKLATDPGSFSLERWEYRRTSDYGSPHFKPDGTKGQEAVTPSSAYLSKDGKSVFLGVPNLKPVMQLRVGWSLATAAGKSFGNNAYLTPYELTAFDSVKEGFGAITVDLTPRQAKTVAATPVSAAEGKRVAELMGCVACHSVDNGVVGKVGPSWKGLYGRTVELAKGGTVKADEAYLSESIKEPAAKVAKGFDKADGGMPSYEGVLTENQIESVILYLKTLK
jgi:cytochrome c2